jgi:ABC transport system ATP-binding/permease protein
LGPSGCGKSTLLRCLAGLQSPSEGEVQLSGRPVALLSSAERRKIGFVPQDDVVHATLRVERTLLYTGRLLGLSGDVLKQRVEEVLKVLELSERRSLRNDRLSGGQRKRVSIGVELMGQPEVLFLDEPTAGLDPALEESFMDNCKALARAGRTLVMSTHVMQSLDTLDLVIVLQQGYLQYLGPPAEALGYFGVKDLTRIYKLLAAQTPQAGAQKFQNAPAFQQYVRARKTN